MRFPLPPCPGTASSSAHTWRFAGSYLVAHDVTTGKRLWRADLPVTDSAPAIANGVVFVGSGDGNLYAFALKDGKQLWRARLGAKAVTSSPTVVGGAVYVGSDEGNVVAFRR